MKQVIKFHNFIHHSKPFAPLSPPPPTSSWTCWRSSTHEPFEGRSWLCSFVIIICCVSYHWCKTVVVMKTAFSRGCCATLSIKLINCATLKLVSVWGLRGWTYDLGLRSSIQTTGHHYGWASFAKKLWLGYAGDCSFRLENTDLGLYSHFYIRFQKFGSAGTQTFGERFGLDRISSLCTQISPIALKLGYKTVPNSAV